MKIAVMQPYFFPYIGYFQLINAVDKFILYDQVNFIKNSWINRNRILVNKQDEYMLRVPLKNKSSFTKISDIEIDDSKKWKEKILKNLKLNYTKSPYYECFKTILEDVIQFQTCKLSMLNINIIKSICRYLKIQTIIEYDPEKANNIENILIDEQYIINKYPGVEKKAIRILEICKIENSNVYYNAFGGQSLYSKDLFTKYGVKLNFIKSNNIVYKQYYKTFIPNLSIIDVIMFNHPDEIYKMLNNYELI